VEKLMKAVLVSRSISFSRTHDLVELHHLLASAVSGWSWDEAELQVLTLGAVDYRYPSESADSSDAAEAYAICTRAKESLVKLLA
jgi:HEPN domain-containing protein